MPTLDERVTALEDQLATLINNLGENNTTLTEALDAIANKIADPELSTSTTAWIDSICPRNPPGCR